MKTSSEYIGGLVQTPDGQRAIAAAGDGHLTLLDMRKGGEKAAEVSCGSPLLCCQTDGQTVAAGSQAGQVICPMGLAVHLHAPSCFHKTDGVCSVHHMLFIPEK